MTKPIIKENSFSVDDIHKIREYHYEMTKNMTREERLREIKEKAENVRRQLKHKNIKKVAI